jgi:hypothetical protein
MARARPRVQFPSTEREEAEERREGGKEGTKKGKLT